MSSDTDHSDDHGPLSVDTALVRELAELLAETGLSEIEVEDGSKRLRLSRTLPPAAAPAQFAPPVPVPPTSSPAAAPQHSAAIPSEDLTGAVRSPMVGTAYLAAEPGTEPFVEIGDEVKPGDTLLIVEAMKVMNAIHATHPGTVTRIMVSNGQPIEFDQPLMIVS